MRPLDWSAALNGSSNLWEIRGVFRNFIVYPSIQISILLFSVGLFLKIYCTIALEKKRLVSRTNEFTKNAYFKKQLKTISYGVALILVSGAVNQSIVWFRIPSLRESPLAQNIMIRWWKDWKNRIQTAKAPQLTQVKLNKARSLIKRYSQMEGDQFPEEPSPDKPISLVHSVFSSPRHTEKLRAAFGLPPKGKLNVILVFLESARAFELFDPHLGPEVYPNLRRIFAKNGLLFTQVYSAAKYTVEGQFSTLCSALDRMDGPTVYTSVPYLKAQCLPNLLVNNGYETYWMNPFYKSFSGKYVFESNHGTQNFFDRVLFHEQKISDEINKTEWGISDEVFLTQALSKLSEIYSYGKPFFAHLLTTGTHVPWREFPEFKISETLNDLTQSAPNHHAYLSSIKAMDSALGHFLDRFFETPMANNTIVLLASDHGTGIFPNYPELYKWQKRLLWPRIILGAVTRNRKNDRENPGTIQYPVNQLDIAPLIASITGLQGETSWLGRDPTLGSGTPWISRVDQKLSYRTQTQLCTHVPTQERTLCRETPPQLDPLFELSLPEKKEDPQLTQILTEVVQANENLLNSGSLAN
jgi:arylsulfatase A-like enzyme